MFLGLGSGAFPVPGVLVLSVLEGDYKVSKQILLYRNIPSLSLPAHPALPSSKRNCKGQAGFSLSSPPARCLSFPFVLLWLIVAISPGWKLASSRQALWHPGAVGGRCCPRRRGSPPCHGEAGEPLPLESAKEVRRGFADGRSCSCLFHNAAFLSRKYYSRNSQSLSDLSVSCRKCVEMGSEHPGLLTRRFPSLLHSPPHTWLWAKPCGCEGGQGGAWSPLTSQPAA